MKLVLFVVLCTLFTLQAVGQRDFNNPRKREKKGLLEEAPVVETPAVDLVVEPVKEKVEIVKEEINVAPVVKKEGKSNPETVYCGCEKLVILYKKRSRLYGSLASSGAIEANPKLKTMYYWQYQKVEKAMNRLKYKYKINEYLNCHVKGITFKRVTEYEAPIAEMEALCNVKEIMEE